MFKAIKILNDQNFLHRFVDWIIALIFLGTPHFTRVDKTSKNKFEQILKADLKAVTGRTITKHGLSAIVSANMAFDEWKTQIPVLTAYETRETRLRGPVFTRNKSVVSIEKS